MPRYHRQQLTHHFSDDSQQQLLRSRVAIIGVGGLGCTVAQMLVGAGVGHVHLVDNDEVSLSNLHRQTLFTEAEVGQPKVSCAQARLTAINADVQIDATHALLDESLLAQLVDYDLIVECSDHPSCKNMVSQWAISENTPCVIAAISHDVFSLYQSPHAPNTGVCWDCLSGLGNTCETQGIIGPIAGIAANTQALASIKRLLGINTGHEGRYLLHDTHRHHIQTFNTKRRATCDCQTGQPSATPFETDSLDPNATWIDIRHRDEVAALPLPFRTLHRPGNLPSDEWADALQANEQYILICQRGVRSLKLATELQALGYKVRSLIGGAEALKPPKDDSLADHFPI